MKMLKMKGSRRACVTNTLICCLFVFPICPDISDIWYHVSDLNHYIVWVPLFSSLLISFIMKTSFFIGQVFIYMIQMKDCNIHII